MPAFLCPSNAFSFPKDATNYSNTSTSGLKNNYDIHTNQTNRNTKTGGNTTIIIVAAAVGLSLVIGIWYWLRGGGVDKAVNNVEKKVNSLADKRIDDKTKAEVLKTINKAEEKIKNDKKIDSVKKESLQKRMEDVKESYNKICKDNLLIHYDEGMWNKINLNNNKPQKRR